MLFHKIPDAVVILQKKKGMYAQSEVYQRAEYLYAKVGTSFVRLTAGGTSNPDIIWDEIDLPFEHGKDRLGRLTNPKTEAGRRGRPRLLAAA